MNGYIALGGQVYTWDTEPVSPFTDDIYTKYPYRCDECQRRYEWSADDMAWHYEQPFLPCGHSWGMLEMVFEDEMTHIVESIENGEFEIMKITPEKLYQADILVQPGQWSANADFAALPEATKVHYTIKASYLNEHVQAEDRYLLADLRIAADFESHKEKNKKDIVVAENLLWLIGEMCDSPQFTPEQQEALRLILTNAEHFQK